MQMQAEYEHFYRAGYFAGRWIRAEIEKQEMTKTTLRVVRGLANKQDTIDSLRDTVERDDLTGTLRRNAFMQQIEERFQRASRVIDFERCHSVLVLDLDNFKKINDSLGHGVGDDCIRYTGNTINETISRDNDLACRWGGEEFVVLLGDTDLDGAKVVANRIQSAINKYMPGAGTHTGQIERLGISIGITEYQQGTDFMAAFNEADAHLLLAKQLTPAKNQIYAPGS